MTKRSYAGARKAILQLNGVLRLAARKKVPLSARDVARDREVSTERALFFLRELEERGKLKKLPWERGVNGFQYEAVDLTLLEVPAEMMSPAKRKYLSKQAEARDRDRAGVVNVERPHVKRTAATQIGMVRDALLQAFFGDWRAA